VINSVFEVVSPVEHLRDGENNWRKSRVIGRIESEKGRQCRVSSNECSVVTVYSKGDKKCRETKVMVAMEGQERIKTMRGDGTKNDIEKEYARVE